MTENQVKFKELYVANVINGSGEMGEELLVLFDLVLAEFNGDPEEMSAFIDEILAEHTPTEPNELEQLRQENAELRQRQEMSEEAILQLSDMILSK